MKTGTYHFLLLALLAVTVVAGTGCAVPGNITGLTATPSDSKIELIWTNPADSSFAGVKIQRKSGGYPSSPSDGTTVYNGTGHAATDTGLSNGTAYYYTGYSYNSSGAFSSGAQAVGVPTTASASHDVLTEFGDVRAVLDGPTGSALPPDMVSALADKLTGAEDAYRGGDPCAAAGLLVAYQDLAQADRQGGSTSIIIEGMEDLYNIGRRLRYDMLAGTGTKDTCPDQARVGVVAESPVDDTANDNTQLGTMPTFGEPKVWTVRAGGGVHTQILIPGADGLTGTPGEPAVPIFRRLIAVPQGAEVTLDFTKSDAETIYCNLYPVQEPAVDQSPNPGPPPDPSVFADKPFVRNDDLYASDTLLPQSPCRITELGQIRDLRVFQLEVAAGQYNPKQNALTLFKSVDVHIAFKGGGNFLTEASLNPFEMHPSVYTGAVLNGSAIAKYIGPIVFKPIVLGEELMILTPPAFLTAAQTLADWKNTKGIVTNVFQVGPGTDFVTNTQIQTLIQNEYDKALTRPSYVLLLGDADTIPPFYTTPNGDVGSATIGTDYPYASFEGLGIFPRVALGRIPVTTLTDANTVVNKIVNYEKTPPGFGHAAFYADAAIASHFQCCRTDVTDHGTDQRTFAETSEFCRNVLIGAGKTVDRIDVETVDGAYTSDSTPRRYFDGTLLPADIGGGSGYGWNGTTNDITTAWNAGRFLMIHRDHGWPGGWGNPGFDWSNASILSNGSLLPVVFSVNCASGLFDDETAGGALGTVSGAAYFAERLLRNANGGAVGLLGDTRNSPSWANSALLRGFMDAIWPNAIPDFGDSTSHRRLGDILNHAKIYLFTQGSSSGAIPWGDVGDEFRMWHCLGDPTLEIWTSAPTFTLPANLVARYAGGALSVQYPTNGATITAVQTDPNGGLVPIGRALVTDGMANVQFLPDVVPNRDAPIMFSVSLNDAVSLGLSQVPAIQ